MPWWVGVLRCAESWGMPPWDVIHAREYIIWGRREMAYRAAMADRLHLGMS